MSGTRVLAALRVTHMIVFVVMSTSAFVLLYAGLTGATGLWLWIAVGLLSVEVVGFVAGGLKCPLSTLAVRCGAKEGHAFDPFLSERFTRHSFRFFGTVMALGTMLLALRYADVIR